MRFLYSLPISLLPVLCLPLGSVAEENERRPELEIITGDGETFRGELSLIEGATCWLTDRAGVAHDIDLRSITKYGKAADQFVPLRPSELRKPLREEFGRDFEILTTRRHAIVAPPGKARAYAKVFEEVDRHFHTYFRRRRFTLDDPRFPLVAIIFPDHASFAAYAKQDGVPAVPGLRGYYHQKTNRVALFDSRGEAIAGFDRVISQSTAAANSDIFASISGGVTQTLIHEATHQLAFNTGLHTRLGENPKWIVEGLATVFEAEGIRTAKGSPSLRQRINDERYRWFQNYRTGRGQPALERGAIVNLIGTEDTFRTRVLNAYAESWALTFYLIETRPVEFSKYLRHIAGRKQTGDYTSVQRLRDFEALLKTEPAWLEVQLLRYFEELQTRVR